MTLHTLVKAISQTSIEVWRQIEKDYTLRLSLVAHEWATDHLRAWNAVFAEGRKRGNAAYYGPALVEMEIANADKRAEWGYRTCCEIWEIQGEVKSRAFFNAVLNCCLEPLFSGSIRGFEHKVERHKLRTNQILDPQSVYLGHLRREMGRLRSQWRIKLEIAARDNEYKQKLNTERDAKRPSANSGSGPELKVQPKRSSKAGRKPLRDREFVRFAGELWRNHQDVKGYVRKDGLKLIAAHLDRSRYCKPSEYLERRAANELNAHNKKFGNSRRNKFLTWSDIATRGTPTFKTAMRKVLSRISKSSGN